MSATVPYKRPYHQGAYNPATWFAWHALSLFYRLRFTRDGRSLLAAIELVDRLEA